MVSSRVAEEDLRRHLKGPELGRISEPGKWGSWKRAEVGSGSGCLEGPGAGQTPH